MEKDTVKFMMALTAKKRRRELDLEALPTSLHYLSFLLKPQLAPSAEVKGKVCVCM